MLERPCAAHVISPHCTKVLVLVAGPILRREVQHAGMRMCYIWLWSSSPAQENSSQRCKRAHWRCPPVQALAKRSRAAPPSTITSVALPEQATMALFRPVLVVAALVAFAPRPTILNSQTALQGSH